MNCKFCKIEIDSGTLCTKCNGELVDAKEIIRNKEDRKKLIDIIHSKDFDINTLSSSEKIAMFILIYFIQMEKKRESSKEISNKKQIM